jgi:hypothetical protein
MTFKKKVKKLGVEAAEQALCSLGLERRRTRVVGPLFKMLTLTAVGCAAGLFLAPRAGRELFKDVVKQWKSGRRSFGEWARG